MSLLGKAGFRYFLRHPAISGLSVLGVTLGVAVFVAMDLGIQSAREAFRISSRTVAGEATHRLVGGGAGVPDSVVFLMRATGVRAAAPVIEGFVVSPQFPDRPLRVLGIDPLSEPPFRPFLVAGEAAGLELLDLLLEPGAALLSRSTAEFLGVEEGGTLPVRAPATERQMRVSGLLEPRDAWSERGLRDLLVVDVAEAQDLLARDGRLDRVDLILSGEGIDEALLSAVEGVLPPDLRIEPVGVREAGMEEMIRAFDLNLTALSLLALLFGGFLIYNTMTFSVLQRRRTLGILRALGAGKGALIRSVLRDAALLGLVGSALGLLLGIVLGRGLVQLVTRTITDLYFVVSVDSLSLPPRALLGGLVLGVGTTLLAALPSAREAASVRPGSPLARASLEERARRLVLRAAVGGLGLIAAGGVLLLLPGSRLLPAFTALFCIVVGLALLTPLITAGAMRVTRPILGRVGGTVGEMAAQSVVGSLSRTAPAVATLVVAVSVTVGLGIMIGSFRASVVDWLDTTLRADLYVSAASLVPGPGPPAAPLPEGFQSLAASLFGVQELTATQTMRLGEPYPGARLQAIDPGAFREDGYHLLTTSVEAPFPFLLAGEGAFVSEPFAFRYGFAPGDTLALWGERGEVRLPVLAVFRDYATEAGSVIVSRTAFEESWGEFRPTSLGISLLPGANLEDVEELLREAAGPEALLSVRSDGELRELSLEIFDRTFAITRALRLLAFLVAFVAILSALAALQLERAREFGVLRSVGLTPRQGWFLMTAQSGLVGGVAGILAIPVGLVLAAIMVFVVNRRSFGWTMELTVSAEHPIYGLLLAVIGSLLAGLVPAWQSFRTEPARHLRSE